jgi:two-component system, NarL family, nitrate/nitrite response regulator NarL
MGRGRFCVAADLAGRLLVAMRGKPAGAVAQGLNNKEIGPKLEIPEKTVKHCMTSILQKLHMRNRVEAAMLARAHFGA